MKSEEDQIVGVVGSCTRVIDTEFHIVVQYIRSGFDRVVLVTERFQFHTDEEIGIRPRL